MNNLWCSSCCTNSSAGQLSYEQITSHSGGSCFSKQVLMELKMTTRQAKSVILVKVELFCTKKYATWLLFMEEGRAPSTDGAALVRRAASWPQRPSGIAAGAIDLWKNKKPEPIPNSIGTNFSSHIYSILRRTVNKINVQPLLPTKGRVATSSPSRAAPAYLRLQATAKMRSPTLGVQWRPPASEGFYGGLL